MALALKRLHQNLGHPSNRDLARHLRISGVGDEVVKAAKSIHCETCSRHKQAGTRRPARLVRQLDFNQEVVLDTLNLFDHTGQRIIALSVLDLASHYHVVKRIDGRTAGSLANTFRAAWLSWAGPPKF